MSETISSLFSILDEMTPKISSGGVAYTLRDRDCHEAQAIAYKKLGHPRNAYEGQGWEETSVNDTLNTFDQGETRTSTLVLENHPADSRVKISKDGIVQTLSSRMGTGGGNTPMLKDEAIVRRLTPLECERLQGYPDGWTDIGDWVDDKGKKHKGESDAPRYKALGNSIALPWWQLMSDRMVEVLKEDGVTNPTMGSLFDGISGFCLVYKRSGAEPRWSSEIEQFPMAVCKQHFGDEENGKEGDINKYV